MKITRYALSLISLVSIFIVSLIVHPALLNAQDSLTIRGVLSGLQSRRVSVSVEGDKSFYVARSQGDSFTVKVPVQTDIRTARLNCAATVSLSKTSESGGRVGFPLPPLDFFVRKNDLVVIGDASMVFLGAVTGDNENDGYARFKMSMAAEDRYMWEARIQQFKLEDKDSLKSKAISAELSAMHLKDMQRSKAFIENNPDEYASLFLLSRMANLYTQQKYEEAFLSIAEEYRSTALGQKLQKQIESLSATAAGKPAIAFSKKDKDGRTITLADFKGKMVLLDFWGSWCGPCRASHPHLKELYQLYHNKGFEIIAIAHETAKTPEEQRAKWLAAIEKDGIPWVHILNNETREAQDLVKAYKVSGFPTKILVDMDGKIMMRVTASATDDIDKALEKAFGTH